MPRDRADSTGKAFHALDLAERHRQLLGGNSATAELDAAPSVVDFRRPRWSVSCLRVGSLMLR